ncbi:MAG: PIN domain-containing protein [FCB group bacterium]|jgi:hypothetical protein|nr:PIN domain-containing protein [FCB group bacterium]
MAPVQAKSPAKLHFVLVDFENVQPKNMSILVGGPFKIKIFLGAVQAKIPLDVARALQAFGSDAEYIQIDGNGSNALDFHIAYYIGRLACEYPEACFHIISKDTGFDPLIKHLRAQEVECHRSTTVTDIPILNIPNSKSGPEKVDAVIENLIKRKAGKPRTLKTLGSTIRSLFVNKLTDDELDKLLDQLVDRGVVAVSDGKVTYDLPA